MDAANLLFQGYLRTLEATGRARATIAGRRLQLQSFLTWTRERHLIARADLTREALAAYPAWMYAQSARSGAALAWSTRVQRVAAVRLLCRWAAREGALAEDPTAAWQLPRVPRRLPQAVLTVREVERVLATAQPRAPQGLRDRAIMELLYSTGIRRQELVNLDVEDVDLVRGVVLVREGKGRKDRLVPVGHRARGWVARYLREQRGRVPALTTRALFVTARGRRLRPSKLTERLHAYIVRAGVNKPGACHIFRHTMATALHDHGADIRDIQEMLGHAELSTTQIYTHISMARLQRVHARAHPAERGYPREAS